MFHRGFQCQGKLRHFNNLLIIQRGLSAQKARHFHFVRAAWCRNGHVLFVRNGAAGDSQIGFANNKRIRRDRAANDTFPQSPTGKEGVSFRQRENGIKKFLSDGRFQFKDRPQQRMIL